MCDAAQADTLSSRKCCCEVQQHGLNLLPRSPPNGEISMFLRFKRLQRRSKGTEKPYYLLYKVWGSGGRRNAIHEQQACSSVTH